MMLVALFALAAATPREKDRTRWTPLDEYVWTPDNSYNWTLTNTVVNEGYTAYTIRLNSQTWLTPAEVTPNLWSHWLYVVVPDVINTNLTMEWVDGGSNGDGAGSPWEPVVQMALAVKAITIELRQIPNQALCFVQPLPGTGDSDGRCRYEDDLIAYTWEMYMYTKNSLWPARLPMVKANVAAHNALIEFAARNLGREVGGFVIAGGSKRGWTVWLTAATDERVKAVVPLVIDIANMVDVMNHHWQVYGRWAAAVGDYIRLMGWLNTPDFVDLLEIEDPMYYFDRLQRIPQYLIYATGDEFFLPENSRFYWDMMGGVKHIRYVPNCEHSMVGHINDILYNVVNFAKHVMADEALPQFSWVTDPVTRAITVSVDPLNPPDEVLLFQATNPRGRSMMIFHTGPFAWRSSPLSPNAEGKYVAALDAPAEGYTAFFIEVRYRNTDDPFDMLKYTTLTSMVPDVYEHPPCGEPCSCGSPVDCAAKGLRIFDDDAQPLALGQ